MKINGGHNKWGISYDDADSAVVVTCNHYPTVGSVKLYEATAEELRKIGEMFLRAANDIEEESEKNRIKNLRFAVTNLLGELHIYEGYSGRGMFDKKSVFAFTTDRLDEQTHDELVKLGFSWDSLGMGLVFYLR